MMKNLFAITTLFAAFAVSPCVAADQPKAEANIEERLRQVELSVTLKHYEKVLRLMKEAELQKVLVSGGGAEADSRVDQLRKLAASLRAEAAEQDAIIRKYREVAKAELDGHGK